MSVNSRTDLFSDMRFLFVALAMFCLQLSALVFAQAPAGAPPKLTPLPFPDVARPPLPAEPTPWLVVIGGGLLITGLVALLLWLLFKLPRLSHPRPSPLARATALLEELKTHLGAMPAGEVSHHVSVILRDYMEGRYDVPALARTTPELYERNANALLNSLRERFSPVAAMYDRLSFAPQAASREDAASLVESALLVLRNEKSNLPAAISVPPPLPASHAMPPPFAN
jgi:hypothetical protein